MKRIKDSDAGNPRFELNVKMVKPLSETTLQNSNGKNYKLCVVEYTNKAGVVKQANAAVYEGNYSKGELTVDTEYLCTATVVDNGGKKVVYMQMSHLVAGAGFADADDFEVEEFVDTETGELTLAGQLRS